MDVYFDFLTAVAGSGMFVSHFKQPSCLHPKEPWRKFETSGRPKYEITFTQSFTPEDRLSKVIRAIMRAPASQANFLTCVRLLACGRKVGAVCKKLGEFGINSPYFLLRVITSLLHREPAFLPVFIKIDVADFIACFHVHFYIRPNAHCDLLFIAAKVFEYPECHPDWPTILDITLSCGFSARPVDDDDDLAIAKLDLIRTFITRAPDEHLMDWFPRIIEYPLSTLCFVSADADEHAMCRDHLYRARALFSVFTVLCAHPDTCLWVGDTVDIEQLAWIFENDDFNIVVGSLASLALQLVTGLPHLIQSLPLETLFQFVIESTFDGNLMAVASLLKGVAEQTGLTWMLKNIPKPELQFILDGFDEFEVEWRIAVHEIFWVGLSSDPAEAQLHLLTDTPVLPLLFDIDPPPTLTNIIVPVLFNLMNQPVADVCAEVRERLGEWSPCIDSERDDAVALFRKWYDDSHE
jgi:hypothetical protein